MWTMLRVAGAFALTAAVVVSTLLVAPSPASACQCVRPRIPKSAEELGDASQRWATAGDIAFVGRRIYAKEIDPWRVVFGLEVARVYHGQAGPHIEVYTNTESNCALNLAANEPVALISWRSDHGRLGASTCSRMTVDELKRVFGAGYQPDPSIGLHGAHRHSTLVNIGADRATGDFEDPSRSMISALVIGLILVLAVTFPTFWLLVSRQRAQSPPTARSPENGA